IANGLPTFATVGLPQGAVKEGRERVYAALANTGYTFPLKRITVNLAPADIRKDGSAFDLPIAVGILAATEQISSERLGRVAVLGELGLEGAIRPVRGALPVALAARLAGLEALVLPRENLPEAGVVSGVRVLGAGNLAELADFLDGRSELPEARVDLAGLLAERAKHDVDFGEVKGQAHAKRALEVAAAGGHNIFIMGLQDPICSSCCVQTPAHHLAFGCVLGVTVIVELPRTLSAVTKIVATPTFLPTTHPF